MNKDIEIIVCLSEFMSIFMSIGVSLHPFLKQMLC